ncbi:hypothetical protein [Hymenobacter sp. BT559]|uniref:hypothetical protein n=1 Tax=Hymenobacter sp. BT559 TaxID=2795729 RepID=UPI0018EAC9C9|nr:hypothetical protein [Hymenobacter sp. BT559]MBJ6141796.1 hypothetical protein [Hymenobacter sp. BT559]
MTKALLFTCCLAVLSLIQSCSQGEAYSSHASYTTPLEQPKTAEELRAELLAQEQSDPATYLGVAGTSRRNFINQLVLEGDIANAATLANFKDPVLSVTWYSKTQTELGIKEYPIYELVRAQGTTHFKLKTEEPSYVATVALGIAAATVVE